MAPQRLPDGSFAALVVDVHAALAALEPVADERDRRLERLLARLVDVSEVVVAVVALGRFDGPAELRARS